MTVNCPLTLLTGQVNSSSSFVSVIRDEIFIKWPVNDGYFKCLLPLKNGSNLVRFETDEFVPQSLEVVANYTPNNQSRFVRLIYLVCHDELGEMFERGTFQSPSSSDNSISSAKEKISFAALMMQTFFAQTIPIFRSFNLEYDQDGLPIVHLFCLQSKQQPELWTLTPEQLWQLTVQEILASSLADANCKYLTFCSFTRFVTKSTISQTISINKLRKLTKALVYLAGDDLALVSSNGLFAWPNSISDMVKCFQNETRIPRSEILDESGGRGNYGGCYAYTFGACVHQLAHLFGLGHSDHGIMSFKFDLIENFFLPHLRDDLPKSIRWWIRSSSLILANHKWFNNFSDASSKTFSISNCMLKSTYGVVTIEYRTIDGIVTRFQEFFQSPKWVKLKPVHQEVILIAIDLKGNFFKAKMHPLKALNDTKHRIIRNYSINLPKCE